MKKIFIYFIMSLSILSTSIDGSWRGNLDIAGIKLPLIFNLKGKDSTLDSPNQNAYGIIINQVTQLNDEVVVTINSIGATYLATLDGNRLKGRFIQNGQSFELELKREGSKSLNRPQEPMEPFDYNSKDIKFKSEGGGFYLSGTLTTPKDKIDFPIVILVSGSGAQDRNSEIFGHKPFLLLSHYLTSRGIGVFRYDDRTIGGSGGSLADATSEDFALDLQGAIKHLIQLGYKDIGVLGHSEGGLIANIAHSKNSNIKFLIHLASPSQRGKEVLISQLLWLLEYQQVDSVSKKYIIDKNTQIFDAIIENEGGLEEQLKVLYKELYPSLALDRINQLIEVSTTPWYKYFVGYNPYEDIKAIDIPTLALYGSKDSQVLAKENIDILREIGNEKIEIVKLDNLNHLFQEAETGSNTEYVLIEETINEEVLELIYSWIENIY